MDKNFDSPLAMFYHDAIVDPINVRYAQPQIHNDLPPQQEPEQAIMPAFDRIFAGVGIPPGRAFEALNSVAQFGATAAAPLNRIGERLLTDVNNLAGELAVRVELRSYRNENTGKPCYAANAGGLCDHVGDLFLPIAIPENAVTQANIGILVSINEYQWGYRTLNLADNALADGNLEGYFLCHEFHHAYRMLSYLNEKRQDFSWKNDDQYLFGTRALHLDGMKKFK